MSTILSSDNYNIVEPSGQMASSHQIARQDQAIVFILVKQDLRSDRYKRSDRLIEYTQIVRT